MAPVTPDEIQCTAEEALSVEPRLWMDLVAEYDARLLQAELLRRGTHYSVEFHAFLDAWALDEEKHAEGLMKLYSLVCREPLDSVQERLALRCGDFEGLEPILDDEFQLAVLFAYDEAMSTRGYSDDIPFYGSLGPPAFRELLHHLKNDEAVHYANAVDLLATRYLGRAGDVPGVMKEIIRLDATQETYKGTFVLDHATSQFTEEQMHQVGASVEAVIVRRLRPTS